MNTNEVQSTVLCNQHHSPLIGGAICGVCSIREVFHVRGKVELFDRGYEDGYAGRPNLAIDPVANRDFVTFQDKADYDYGWKAGDRNRPKPSTAPCVVRYRRRTCIEDFSNDQLLREVQRRNLVVSCRPNLTPVETKPDITQ